MLRYGVASSADPAPWRIQNSIAGVAWPALPGTEGAAVLAVLQQLDRTQWLAPGRLRELQSRQLNALLMHAHRTVPFYGEHWDGTYRPGRALALERLAGLPVLTRRALQDGFASLKSRSVPAEHGAAFEARTSGSTGAPVRVVKTLLTTLLWKVITLREHLWHRRELGRKLAVIRKGVAPGEAPSWGPATDGLAETGRCAMLDVDVRVEAQLDWLERQQPAYFLTYPSLAAELARESLARGLRLPGLLELRTLGESLDPDVRFVCREAWGVPVTDVYSAEEAGPLALQCPQHEHYHVQSECVVLEVLDERGRACAPGEIGRVVVTPLHNFATPLVRYEIGDYAEVGEPCPCGRGLPVLRRILGRVRNMLVTRDGARYWPSFGQRGFAEIAPVLQFQMVQKSYDLVEARLVTRTALSASEEERLRERVASHLPPGIRVMVARVERIARGAGGKYEDFVSEVVTA